LTGFFQQTKEFCFSSGIASQRILLIVVHQLATDSSVTDGTKTTRKVIHLVQQNERPLRGFVRIMKQGTVSGSMGGCPPNRGRIAIVGSIEFDDAPTHVCSNGANHRCFADARRTNEKHARSVWTPGTPFLQPLTQTASLRIVPFQLALRRRAMPLRPIADWHGQRLAATVYQPAVKFVEPDESLLRPW
jgi:hypothetical protein